MLDDRHEEDAQLTDEHGRTVDLSAVRRHYASSAESRVLYDFLAKVKSLRPTEIDDIEDKAGVSRASALAFFRFLEKHDVGRLVVGRLGKKTRFEWHFPPREIGKTAAEGGTAPYAPPDVRFSVTVDGPETPMMELSFVLRHDLTLRFLVPKDLTHAEAMRVSKFFESASVVASEPSKR